MNTDSLLKKLSRYVVFNAINIISNIIGCYKKKAIIPDTIHHILVIDIGMLGDLLMATPLLAGIKAIYPYSSLTIVCTPWAVEAIRNNPHVDTVITYEAFWEDRSTQSSPCIKHLISTYNILNTFKKNRYDIAFIVTARQQPIVNLIGYLSGSAILIGIRYPLGCKLLTHSVDPENKHIVIQKASLLQFVAPEYRLTSRMEYIVTIESRNFVDNFIDEHIKKNNCEYVCLTPSSLQISKRWRSDAWVELTDLIIASGLIVYLCGGNDDKDYVDVIYSKVMQKDRCYNLSGIFTFNQFAALIEKSKLLITVDSAPVHLAAALEVQCLVLCSRIYDYHKYMPAGNLTTIMVKKVECYECLKGCEQADCMDFNVYDVYNSYSTLVRTTED